MAEAYNAGVATAYGAARRGGYTGTYEEFCAQQAGFAVNAQTAQAAAQAATARKNEAVLSAAEALQHAGAAEAAKEAAEVAAREAAETVVAAQGPGLCYVDSEGIPYVLE